jgi:hypothetical protein
VDPLRINPGGDIKENLIKLEELTQQFLDAILASIEKMPMYNLFFLSFIH